MNCTVTQPNGRRLTVDALVLAPAHEVLEEPHVHVTGALDRRGSRLSEAMHELAHDLLPVLSLDEHAERDTGAWAVAVRVESETVKPALEDHAGSALVVLMFSCGEHASVEELLRARLPSVPWERFAINHRGP